MNLEQTLIALLDKLEGLHNLSDMCNVINTFVLEHNMIICKHETEDALNALLIDPECTDKNLRFHYKKNLHHWWLCMSDALNY